MVVFTVQRFCIFSVFENLHNKMARKNGQKLFPFSICALAMWFLYILPSRSGLFFTLWIWVGHQLVLANKSLANMTYAETWKVLRHWDFTILLTLRTLQLPSYKPSWASLLDDDKHMAQ